MLLSIRMRSVTFKCYRYDLQSTSRKHDSFFNWPRRSHVKNPTNLRSKNFSVGLTYAILSSGFQSVNLTEDLMVCYSQEITVCLFPSKAIQYFAFSFTIHDLSCTYRLLQRWRSVITLSSTSYVTSRDRFSFQFVFTWRY